MGIKTFVERPVLSTVISVVIALLGIIGLATLPIEQYPDIAPPTVMVMTQYYGASAESVQKSVVAPLEEAINGVENMTYMTSNATNTGMAEIYVYFKQGTDPDMAAVNVQNKISTATAQLPTEVKVVGVQAIKRQTSMLQIFTVSSPDDTFDEQFLANYININIKPELLRIPGVGQLVVLGGTYSMRVWMQPDKMAQYGLVPSDVTAALAEQNIESATGAIGENSDEAFQYTMRYSGRLETPEEFGNIVIRSTADGEILRLKDVAEIELGIESYGYHGRLNGHEGVQCMVFQTAGSNATEVNNRIDALLADVQANAPRGVKVTQMMSTNDFLFASIKNVVVTLLEAVLLVILIVLLFLQDWRSTMIPFISIVVSLVGTFAFMVVADFSINLITLFALVLVIGTVVDNSIVIVEAVHSRFDAGYKNPFQAAVYGTKDVAIAIITSSLVFMAVFIPISFMSGTSGVFYRQFGLTMAVAVGISTVNALTLCPALCALWLRPKDHRALTPEVVNALRWDRRWQYKFSQSWNNGFAWLTRHYQRLAAWFIRRPWLCFGTAVAGIALMVLIMRYTKTALVPQEDLGTVMINIDTPPGSSLATTDSILRLVETRLRAIPEVKEVNAVAGYGLISGQSSAAANMILKLKPWDDRRGKAHAVGAVIEQVYARTADIKDAKVFAMAPAQISGYGTGNALDINLQDKLGGDMQQFYDYAQQFLIALNQRKEIAMAFTSFRLNSPQWEVSVDAAKCQRSGVSANEVLNCLAGYYGGQYVSDFNRFGKVYKVQIMGDPSSRTDERSLDNTFVRLHNGEMAPLSQFITLTKVYGTDKLTRFNLYNSIAVSAMPADGYSSGDAIKAVREVAAAMLPSQYGVDFGGITREESQTSNTGTMMIFLICIVLIYLILSALYESFRLPLAVIVAVPVGLMGSFLFTKIAGLENNIYLQTGVIMLIGLLSKTAILITEYAAQRRREGKTIEDAATEAAGARLRPILMTVLTLIFGMFPMVAATGVGANGNRSLGTGVVGGSILGTLGLLLLVPAFFVVFQRLDERRRRTPSNSPHRGGGLMVLLVLIVGLSSCGIYGKYKPIETLEQGTKNKEQGLNGLGYESSGTIANQSLFHAPGSLLPWDSLFTDPYLRALIDTALVHNLDLRVAHEHVQQAEAALRGAQLAYVPSVSLSPSAGFSPQGGIRNGTYDLIAAASWEFDIFGRTLNSLRGAKAAKAQMLDYEQASRCGLIAGVANTYYTLLMLDAQLATAQETECTWAETVSTMRKLKAAGMSDEAAVTQMEATYYAIQTTVLDLRQQIYETENAMWLMVWGDDPPRPSLQREGDNKLPSITETNLTPSLCREGRGGSLPRGSLDDQQLPEVLMAGIPADMLLRRPDVRAAEQNMARAFYAVNYARSSFFPSLTLSGSLEWTNHSYAMLIDPMTFISSLAASLFVPLFQSGRNVQQLKMAKSQQREALLTFSQTVLTAGNEVNNALHDYQTLTDKQSLYDSQVEALQRAARATKLKMQYGSTTYLEVLTAQNSLLQAQFTLIANRMQTLQAVVTLYRALGGGSEYEE